LSYGTIRRRGGVLGCGTARILIPEAARPLGGTPHPIIQAGLLRVMKTPNFMLASD